MRIDYYKDGQFLDFQWGMLQVCLFFRPTDWALYGDIDKPFDTFPWWLYWWYLQIGPLWIAWD